MASRVALRVAVSLVGAALSPAVIMAVCLLVSNPYWRHLGPAAGWAMMGLSVATGAACLAWLPVHPAARLFAICLYVVPAGMLTYVYSLYFVGFVFGDWL